MRLNYNHLRYFWVVARDGNLTRAAERLGVSQSALSIQIKKLEEQLGQPLFDRRGRGLALTEAGRLALDYADAIFHSGEELLGALGKSVADDLRTLRVGALATLSRNFLSAFLEPLFGQAGVAFELRSGSLPELMTELEGHHLDLVLANQEPLRESESRWIAHRVAEQPVSLIGSESLIGVERDVFRLLAAHPLILPSRLSGVRSGFDAFIARAGVAATVLAEVDDMAMMRVLARRDLGLAVLPPIVVQDELESGRLIEAARLSELSETFVAITMQRRRPNPLIWRLLRTASGQGGPGSD